jgi:heptosyltransferase-2/heptosyltransferase-3
MFSCVPVVVRFGALDDMVLLTPLLHLLHLRYGQPCHVIGTGRWLEPLLAGHPDVRTVLNVSNPGHPYWLDGTQRAVARRLGTRLQGAAYVCDDLATDRARRLLRRGGVLEDQSRFATPDCPPRAGEHWNDRWQRFSAMTPPAFALPVFHADPGTAAAPRLALDASDRADLAEWLARHGLARTKIILLQPEGERAPGGGRRGPPAETGCWAIAKWMSLIHALLIDPADFSILVCGAPSEGSLSKELAGNARSPRVRAVGDDLPMRRFMALCEHAAAMVAVDSGRAHVAAALGCPLIVLFGARQPSLWCPRSPVDSPVHALGGAPVRARMDEVSVDEVMLAWREIRARLRDPGSPCSRQGLSR